MISELQPEDRMNLMRFLCSFAWADLEIAPRERGMVTQMMEKLELTSEEREQVADWLVYPPAPEDVDPTTIPPQHRAIFLRAINDMVGADGIIDDAEKENLTLFCALLADDDE
jgi:uncharacterized tellurite resistance protein B-like protein